MTQATAQPAGPVIGKQIKLPLSKAVEIAWKSIRLRLSRSLLVTSGIVLALAFLISVMAGDSVVQGMRDWVNAAATSPQFTQLRDERAKLEATIDPLRAKLLTAARSGKKPAADAPKFDPEKTFGKKLEDIQQEIGQFPVPPADLVTAITAEPALLDTFKQWMDQQTRLHAVREELNGPQNLLAVMNQQGVPTKPDEIAAAKTQNRWLLGLALLVAFVGILNSMLMSVTERFREIGTMKCLGALDSFIIKLFLIESLFQGIVGTVIGVALGLALSLAMAGANYGHYAFVNMPWDAIGTSVAIALVVGVGLTVAGAVYPAWQAARMHPIEAMRTET
jgi:ABC-type antimicrobial peptide transport system permease subunit